MIDSPHKFDDKTSQAIEAIKALSNQYINVIKLVHHNNKEYLLETQTKAKPHKKDFLFKSIDVLESVQHKLLNSIYNGIDSIGVPTTAWEVGDPYRLIVELIPTEEYSCSSAECSINGINGIPCAHKVDLYKKQHSYQNKIQCGHVSSIYVKRSQIELCLGCKSFRHLKSNQFGKSSVYGWVGALFDPNLRSWYRFNVVNIQINVSANYGTCEMVRARGPLFSKNGAQ